MSVQIHELLKHWKKIYVKEVQSELGQSWHASKESSKSMNHSFHLQNKKSFKTLTQIKVQTNNSRCPLTLAPPVDSPDSAAASSAPPRLFPLRSFHTDPVLSDKSSGSTLDKRQDKHSCSLSNCSLETLKKKKHLWIVLLKRYTQDWGLQAVSDWANKRLGLRQDKI